MGARSDLVAFLVDNPPKKKFTPYCFQNKEADTLTAYFSDAADYSKRLNDHVTLYLSLATDEIVGCRIKGIGGILEDLPNYIKVSHGPVKLSIIFWAFRGCAEAECLQTINQLASEANKHNLAVK